MKYEIIGFKLLRNNKHGFIFTIPIYSHINKNENRYTIKDYAKCSHYEILLLCIDSEEYSITQFKYNRIRKKFRPKDHIPIRDLPSRVINIKYKMSIYKKML